MEVKVIRFSTSNESTLGLMLINNKFECFTLEDGYRINKVPGETRIPAGRYKIRLRKEGAFHNRYSKRFPDIHKGMLHITKVPNYEYILIHCGNDAEDTVGCLLVGDELNNNLVSNGYLKNSTQAYVRVYSQMCKALQEGEEVCIEYSDRLETTNESNQTFEESKNKVNVEYLNLRVAPNMKGSGILIKGTEVTIQGVNNDWCKIGCTGWVKRDYLSKSIKK